MRVPEELLASVEMHWIRRLRPELNKKLGRPSSGKGWAMFFGEQDFRNFLLTRHRARHPGTLSRASPVRVEPVREVQREILLEPWRML
jgi:hypothetical protein